MIADADIFSRLCVRSGNSPARKVTHRLLRAMVQKKHMLGAYVRVHICAKRSIIVSVSVFIYVAVHLHIATACWERTTVSPLPPHSSLFNVHCACDASKWAISYWRSRLNTDRCDILPYDKSAKRYKYWHNARCVVSIWPIQFMSHRYCVEKTFTRSLSRVVFRHQTSHAIEFSPFDNGPPFQGFAIHG